MDVSELVMSTGSGGERPHKTDGAIANELWSYKIKVYHDVIRAGRNVDLFRDSSGGEEHENKETPTFQFGKVPRSMIRHNFTVKSACVFFSYISWEALLNRVT